MFFIRVHKVVFVSLFVFIGLFVVRSEAHALEPNLIPNGTLEESSTNGLPTGWKKGGYGTNIRTLTYPVPGYVSTRAVKTTISTAGTGDAKWYFDPVTVEPNKPYQFTDVYRSTVESFVTVEFTKIDGTKSYLDLGRPAPSSTWKIFSAAFTTPPNTKALTVFHLIKNVGYIETDAYELRSTTDPTKFDKGYVSIQFDDGRRDAYANAFPILNAAGMKANVFIITGRMKENDFPGYVKAAEVLEMAADGHEVGAHTRTHTDLTTLSASAALSEIQGSRNDLLALGITPIDHFAYPYGAYNASVQQLVRDAGFKSGRSSDGGYNLKTTNHFALKRQPMVNTTTFSTAKQYIDTARKDKTWVILLFHQVDTTGETYSVTPTLFSQIVSYLESIGEEPITITKGLSLMNK